MILISPGYIMILISPGYIMILISPGYDTDLTWVHYDSDLTCLIPCGWGNTALIPSNLSIKYWWRPRVRNSRKLTSAATLRPPIIQSITFQNCSIKTQPYFMVNYKYKEAQPMEFRFGHATCELDLRAATCELDLRPAACELDLRAAPCAAASSSCELRPATCVLRPAR